MDNIAIPSQRSDSVRSDRLIRRLVQSDFSRGLVPRSASELFQGATLAELRFSLRVFSDSDDRAVLEGLLKDAPGAVPSTEVFESLTKATMRVNAARPDDNKSYDIGFGEAQEETAVDQFRMPLMGKGRPDSAPSRMALGNDPVWQMRNAHSGVLPCGPLHVA